MINVNINELGLSFVKVCLNVDQSYDPSLLLTIKGDTLLYQLGNHYFNINEEKASYKTQNAIMKVVYYNDISRTDSFLDVISKTKIDYITLYDSSPINDHL